MYNHQDSWLPTEALQLDAIYAKQLAQWHNILFAFKEGVFEVTIRSQSVTETVVLDGGQIAWELSEAVSAKLSDTESSLRRHLGDKFEALDDEERGKQARIAAGAEAARKERERMAANDKAFNDQYAKQQATLAQQAAATAAPAQRRPGRPKRQPQPEVAQQLAVAAGAVPMNGSKSQPGGQASNLPKG